MKSKAISSRDSRLVSSVKPSPLLPASRKPVIFRCLIVQNATPPPPPAGSAPPAGGGGGGFGGAQTPAGATAAWEPIKEEVDKLLQFEYDSKTALDPGSEVRQERDRQDDCGRLHAGNHCIEPFNGVLAADSPFVKSTLSDLDTYVKAGGSGQLKLSTQPKGDAETEVFNAMKISLHLN